MISHHLLHLKHVTNLPLPGFIRFGFVRIKKKSEWVYTNKFDQMTHAHQGRIFICNDIGNDVFNCTLRMMKAYEASHIVMAYKPLIISKFLRTVHRKDRFVDILGDQQSGIIKSEENQDLIPYNKSDEKVRRYDESMQLSKHLQYSLQTEKIMKTNHDKQNRLLKLQQEQLLKFMELSNIKEELLKFKQLNGHSKVIQLQKNLQRIETLRKGGIDIVCVIHENHIRQTKSLFNYLHEKNMAYEMLPASNQLINLLAASGFPADRFAIEYFPLNIGEVLKKRRPMKMTVGLVLYKSKVSKTLEEIESVYGKEHMIYLQNEKGQNLYRGIVSQIKQNFIDMNDSEEVFRLAVSPYLSTFNEQLKEEKSKVSRLYGEAMHENTHFVRIEFINKQLEQLLKRKDLRKVNVNDFIQEIISRVDEPRALKIIQEVLKIGAKQSNVLLNRAKKGISQDPLNLKQFYSKR